MYDTVLGYGGWEKKNFKIRSYAKMATDMNMFVMIDICRSSCVDRCEHESRELSLRTPVCYTTYRHIYIYIYIYAHPPP